MKKLQIPRQGRKHLYTNSYNLSSVYDCHIKQNIDSHRNRHVSTVPILPVSTERRNKRKWTFAEAGKQTTPSV